MCFDVKGSVLNMGGTWLVFSAHDIPSCDPEFKSCSDHQLVAQLLGGAFAVHS